MARAPSASSAAQGRGSGRTGRVVLLPALFERVVLSSDSAYSVEHS